MQSHTSITKLLKRLIIHQTKTKEIATVEEVWKCDLNYHKICELLLRIYPRIINSLRSYIKHSKECFLLFPNTSKLVKKNLAAPSFFQPTSRCLEIGGNTLPRVWSLTWDIPHPTKQNRFPFLHLFCFNCEFFVLIVNLHPMFRWNICSSEIWIKLWSKTSTSVFFWERSPETFATQKN